MKVRAFRKLTGLLWVWTCDVCRRNSGWHYSADDACNGARWHWRTCHRPRMPIAA